MHAVFRDAFRQANCWLVLFELVEARPELDQSFPVEAGADLAGIAQLPVRIVIADQQCAEALPAAFGVGEADDYELLAIEAFDLAPLGATAMPIWLVGALRDRAFELVFACLTMELDTAPPLMIAVAHSARRAVRHDLGERRFAVFQHRAGQIVAVAVQEIEREVDEVVDSAG